MNNNIRNLFAVTLITLVLFAVTLITLVFAVATTTAQTRAYTASDSQVQTLLNRIETQTDTYKRNISEALDRSSLNNTDSEDMLMKYITEFENSTDALKQRFEAKRSGRVSGRANVSLEFDTIRLRNGQTYRFAGIVDGVKNVSGENVSVNNEVSVRDNNQTSKTIKRGAIGAVVGAVVGGGAGAGTVLIQGKDDVELDSGSEFRITSTAPSNLNSQR